MTTNSEPSPSSQTRLDSTLEELPTGATYVIGVAVFRTSPASTQQLLVVKRAPSEKAFPNMWEIPGGHVEAGETVREAVVRETKEETDLDVETVTGEFDEMHWLSRKGTKKNVQMNFAVTVKTGVEVKTNPEERTEFLWAKEGDVLGLGCTEEMRKVLRDAFAFAKTLTAE